MEWVIDNWFWVLIFGGFIFMHLFGHKHHGSHGSHGSSNHNHCDKDHSDKSKDLNHQHH